MALNERQQRFAAEYLIDLNAAAAARRAGYSPRTADREGHRLLRNAEIQGAIQAAMTERAQRTQITADRVLKEIAAVAFSDLGQLIEFGQEGFRFRPADQVSESARRCVSAIKVRREVREGAPPADIVEFRLWPKVEALDKLCRHLGMYAKDNPFLDADGKPLPVLGLRIVPHAQPVGANGHTDRISP